MASSSNAAAAPAAAAAAAPAARPWHSTRGRQVTWDRTFALGLASDWHAALPGPLRELIGSPEWQGTVLVPLKSVTAQAKASDIAKSWYWLLPVVQRARRSVPSVFFLADCMLLLDDLMGNVLFRNQGNISATTRAMQEAAKIKHLVSGLRFLYRASTGSRHPRIAVLKAELRPSRKEEGPPSGAADAKLAAWIQEGLPVDLYEQLFGDDAGSAPVQADSDGEEAAGPSPEAPGANVEDDETLETQELDPFPGLDRGRPCLVHALVSARGVLHACVCAECVCFADAARG
jgi:hypothetical protein